MRQPSSKRGWFERLLFGEPLATEESEGQRVGPLSGVPILGLDALASASYGPEALLTVLLPLGAAGLRYMPVLTLVITGVLGLLFVSYRQTISAYPGGGGAYTVARENLGVKASLLAAAALALDYVLNAAVAISAGVGAAVSALPALKPHSLLLCIGLLTLLTLINLRGVRATGVAFMLPTYLFVGSMMLVLAIAALRAPASGLRASEALLPSQGSVPVWLLLRAFANGCTAMTGVEAVSNGVPIFHKPEAVGAKRTLGLIITLLVLLLVGITYGCLAFGITATEPGTPGYESVVSRLVSATVGRGPLYYITLGSAGVVLALSANTSFADFPRLCRFLAGDGYLPEAFVHRGRRLSFSFGILVLAALSGLLLVAFGGVTDALIPLFAVGALAAFTLSQAGMVAHWRKQPGRHATNALALNALGAFATGATLLVVLVSKLTEGAWLTLVLVLAMLVLFRQVRRHYDFVARVTASDAELDVTAQDRIAVVPLRRWDAVSLKALRYAAFSASRVIALQVLTDDRKIEDLTARWGRLAEEPARRAGLPAPELRVLQSPYRQLLQPLLDAIFELSRQNPDRQIAVVIPELIEARWYHFLLHNHTAAALKALLLLRGGPEIVVVSTPWYLGHWLPERRAAVRRLWRRLYVRSGSSRS